MGLLAPGGHIDGTGRHSRLIDRDDGAVADQGEVGRVQVGQVRTEVKRSAADGPEGEHGLAFRRGQPVAVAIAQFQGVEIIPSARAGIADPRADIGEALDHVGPLGQVPGRDTRVAAAPVAFDVVADPPAVGGRLPELRLVDAQVAGQLQPDGMARMCQGAMPVAQLLAIVGPPLAPAGTHEVELQKIHSPAVQLRHLGVHEGGGAGLAEIYP